MIKQRQILTPPSRPRILIVHKRTLYEWYLEREHDEHVAALLKAKDLSVGSMRLGHDRHQRALEKGLETLAQCPGLDVEIFGRERLADYKTLSADLVIVFGGDGTVLETSHYVEDTPLLGVNSDHESSVGFLCTDIAERFPALLNNYLEGRLLIRPLTRLALSIDQKRVGPPVLNDILFSHHCPAATSTYIMQIGERVETQKSSGIWISTAAGSTAAIRSAGGLPMDLDDPRLQFRVREPYINLSQTYQLITGWVRRGERLRMISKMRLANLYLDGPHTYFPVQMGARIAIQTATHPLRQVWSPTRRAHPPAAS